jgi:hypothetical protein
LTEQRKFELQILESQKLAALVVMAFRKVASIRP